MIEGIQTIPFFISDDKRKQYIHDIVTLIKKGIWFKEVNHYQTYADLLEQPYEIWQELKTKFIFEIERLVNCKPKKIKGWAYVSFVGLPGSKVDRWHNHIENQNLNQKSISSIFYLQCEKLHEGTMFEMDDLFIIPKVDLNTLYFFNPKILHTPSYWDYEKNTINRVVLSIEAMF